MFWVVEGGMLAADLTACELPGFCRVGGFCSQKHVIAFRVKKTGLPWKRIGAPG